MRPPKANLKEKAILNRLAREVLGFHVEEQEIDRIVVLVLEARKALDRASSLMKNHETPVYYTPRKVSKG